MHIRLDKGVAHAATCQCYEEQTSFVPGSIVGKESVLGPASCVGRMGGGEVLRRGVGPTKEGGPGTGMAARLTAGPQPSQRVAASAEYCKLAFQGTGRTQQ